MAIVIQVYNMKGGVGKTSTSIAIAGELAKNYGKRVLLCDFDVSSNASKGIAHTDTPEEYFADMLLAYFEEDLQGDIMDTIVPTDFENLYLMPSGNGMSKASSGLLRNDEFNPSRILEVFFDDLIDKFDYIIIDSAQSDNNVFALMSLSYPGVKVLSPTDDNLDGMEGFRKVLAKINRISKLSNNDLDFLGVFMNRVSSRKSLSNLMFENYQNNYPEHFIPITVRESAVVGKARIAQKPLCFFASKEAVTDDFHQLTEYILNKTEGKVIDHGEKLDA